MPSAWISAVSIYLRLCFNALKHIGVLCAYLFKVYHHFLKESESNTSYFTITRRHHFSHKYVEWDILAGFMDSSGNTHCKRTICDWGSSSLTAPPPLLTLIPWSHFFACLLGTASSDSHRFLHRTPTTASNVWGWNHRKSKATLSTIRILSCRDVSNGLKSCMGARSQQWIKGPWTALWGGSRDSGLDQWTRTTLTPTPACAHSPEQEEAGKDREHGSGDPSGSSLYFPETW